eukprot:gnl/TRDRNA2_/TRDRNA2_41663_c0_seq1.p1 gnl/TRDRNA2_/TRDRNA2_41663_c0~~gnl/TRDRNA2_/TRDRNA2_41663_c0_seq1.p1  ORF type:complete len:411 (+),score=74.66 gnl/TRDRNA2_/TRDRNA2_41663_c0_seq1:37-1233(+)
MLEPKREKMGKAKIHDWQAAMGTAAASRDVDIQPAEREQRNGYFDSLSAAEQEELRRRKKEWDDRKRAEALHKQEEDRRRMLREEAAWQRIVARARSDGVHDSATRGAPGVDLGAEDWYCPHCDRVIPGYQLEQHLDSKKHTNYMEELRRMQAIEYRQRRGELPDWMEVREGAEFCRLCSAFATDGHLASDKHRKRLGWHESQASCQPCAELANGSSSSSTAIAVARAAAHSGSAGYAGQGTDPPAHWGDPRLFMFEDGWWRCRLCDQWADDSHVGGNKHLKRLDHIGYYLGEELRDATAASASLPGDLEPPWKCAWSADQQRYYYYNEETKSVQWDRPTPPALTLGTGSQDVVEHVVRPNPWRQYKDKASGRTYYHNQVTQETTWTLPDDVVLDEEC